jgi:hypothetical protein
MIEKEVELGEKKLFGHPDMEKYRYRGGKPAKTFCFTYGDIAGVMGRTEDAIRMDVSRKKLNLGDLGEFLRYVRKEQV